MTTRAILYALISAVLFGISTPAAKAFLGSTDPTVLAGLLYCGAGVGVALIRRFVRPMLSPPGTTEMALRHGDLPWLSGAIIAGGVVGPVLLLVGLAQTNAATTSLLLTLEGAATALIFSTNTSTDGSSLVWRVSSPAPVSSHGRGNPRYRVSSGRSQLSAHVSPGDWTTISHVRSRFRIHCRSSS